MKSSKYPGFDFFSKERPLTSILLKLFKKKKSKNELKEHEEALSNESPTDPIGIYTKELASKVRDQNIKTQQAKKLWEEKKLGLAASSSVEDHLIEKITPRPTVEDDLVEKEMPQSASQEAKYIDIQEVKAVENFKIEREMSVDHAINDVEKPHSSKPEKVIPKSALGSSLEILKDSGDQVFGKIYKMQMFSKSGNAIGSSMKALRLSGDQISQSISKIPAESGHVMGSTLEVLKNSGSNILGKIPKVPKTSNAMGSSLIGLIESFKRPRK